MKRMRFLLTPLIAVMALLVWSSIAAAAPSIILSMDTGNYTYIAPNKTVYAPVINGTFNIGAANGTLKLVLPSGFSFDENDLPMAKNASGSLKVYNVDAGGYTGTEWATAEYVNSRTIQWKLKNGTTNNFSGDLLIKNLKVTSDDTIPTTGDIKATLYLTDANNNYVSKEVVLFKALPSLNTPVQVLDVAGDEALYKIVQGDTNNAIFNATVVLTIPKGTENGTNATLSFVTNDVDLAGSSNNFTSTVLGSLNATEVGWVANSTTNGSIIVTLDVTNSTLLDDNKVNQDVQYKILFWVNATSVVGSSGPIDMKVTLGSTTQTFTLAEVTAKQVDITSLKADKQVPPGSESFEITKAFNVKGYLQNGTTDDPKTLEIWAPEGVEIKNATISDSSCFKNGAATVTPDGSYAWFDVNSTCTDINANVTMTIKTASDLAIGQSLDFTIKGSAVEGIIGDSGADEITIAIGKIATPATVNATAVRLEPGMTETQKTGKITITELFEDAFNTNGTFRIFAPDGIRFAGCDSKSSNIECSVNSTNRDGDTLTLEVSNLSTDSNDTLWFIPKVFVASDFNGEVEFRIVDGDQDGENKIGLGTLDPVVVGTTSAAELTVSPASVSVAVGQNVTVTVSNNLGAITANPTNAAIATTSVSGTTVTITGVSEGTTTVTVRDAGDETTITVTVTGAQQVVAPTNPLEPQDLSNTVDPAATVVPASPVSNVSFAPQLNIDDCANLQAGLMYVYLPDLGFGLDVSPYVSSSCASGVVTISLSGLDLTGFSGLIDVYYGYILNDGTIKYNAYEVNVQ